LFNFLRSSWEYKIIYSNKRHQGSIFRTFFSGENFGENSAEIFPQKCWEKMEFSAEKVFKICFSKKFRGIFRGKWFSENRPLVW
jgi:hypothetical protein